MGCVTQAPEVWRKVCISCGFGKQNKGAWCKTESTGGRKHQRCCRWSHLLSVGLHHFLFVCLQTLIYPEQVWLILDCSSSFSFTSLRGLHYNFSCLQASLCPASLTSDLISCTVFFLVFFFFYLACFQNDASQAAVAGSGAILAAKMQGSAATLQQATGAFTHVRLKSAHTLQLQD